MGVEASVNWSHILNTKLRTPKLSIDKGAPLTVTLMLESIFVKRCVGTLRRTLSQAKYGQKAQQSKMTG